MYRNIEEYKKISQLRKNAYYAGLIQNLLFGSEGVCIFVLQLKYQISILENFNEGLSKTLYEIMEVEELHEKFLSHAILMTGGDPMLCNSQSKWISGRNIDYVKEIKQIIALNLEIKEKALLDLKSAFLKIDNNEIKNLLKTIIDDENITIKKFKTIMSSFST